MTVTSFHLGQRRRACAPGGGRRPPQAQRPDPPLRPALRGRLRPSGGSGPRDQPHPHPRADGEPDRRPPHRPRRLHRLGGGGAGDLPLRRGARLLLGGQRLPNTRGNFFPPTLLAGVPNGAKIMQEESLGPVVPVQKVKIESGSGL
ncbi:MAG: aldehyde dehydrogenase family protein [Planctomycetes bacterium]|nr:aldehyde dehydrogenase family protein [Planctomycetota bacterium]